MKLRYIIGLTALFGTLSALGAQRNIPSGYYSRLDGKSGAALKTAACEVVYRHTKLSYSSLWDYYPETDTYPGGTQWWDMYSDEVRYVRSGSSGMNKEHCVPNSWWGGIKNEAYSDLHHLFPSDATANNRKSNYPMGDVDRTKTVNYTNGVTTVGQAVSGQGGGSSIVFEPDDRYKGDMARAYLYVVTCYQDFTWVARSGIYGHSMFQDNTYPTLNAWAMELLLRWSREDPVSQKEIDRNEAVYDIQHNRNPFVDVPGLEEYIWGTRKTETFVLADHLGGGQIDPTPGGDDDKDPDPDPVDPTPSTKDGVLTSPSANFTLEFGEVALGMGGSAQLLVCGENLDETKGLELVIYDMSDTDDAGLFTIDGAAKATVSTTAVNSPQGLSVRIDYKPTRLGEHETYLVARRGGLKQAVSIKLHGFCEPMPDLSAPKALEATDVTETSYTANWEPVEGEEVDYYILNRTRYVSGVPETERIEVEGATSYVVDDYCGAESYTVQSVRLEVESPESNSVSVSRHSAINGVNAEERFGLRPTEGGVLLTCTDAIPELRILDPAGRTVAVIYDARNNDVIPLPAGMYIFRASTVAAPVKILLHSNL